MQPTLYIMQGLPGSGKSAMCDELRLDLYNKVTVISKDEIRATDPSLNERQVHAKQRELLQDAMISRASIILDNCNLDERTLNEYHAQTKQFQYQEEIVQSPYWNDVEACIANDAIRREAGERYVGRSVIRQMAQRHGLIGKPPRERRPKTIICDLDGTLCDIKHRRHFVDGTDGSKKDWPGFFEALTEDTLNEAVAKTVQLYHNAGYYVIYLSGRNGKYRRLTENWIEDNSVDWHFALYMRNDADRRDDTIIKADLYDKYVEPYFDVQLVLDDRDRVVEQWRDKYGLPTFQVAAGNF
jgi:predicted kinase